MRISDWSSDVCSSDLNSDGDIPLCISIGSQSSSPHELSSPALKSFIDDVIKYESYDAAGAYRKCDIERRTMRRSEEHTSEVQSLMRNSYAVFCSQKRKKQESRQAEQVHRQHQLQ